MDLRVIIVDDDRDFLEIMGKRMQELGYVEGRHITYDLHVLSNDHEANRRTAKELVADGVDLIFAFPEAGETDAARPLANEQFFTRLCHKDIRNRWCR